MFKRFITIFIFLCISCSIKATDTDEENIRIKIKNYKSTCKQSCLNDSVLVLLYDKLMWELKSYDIDSALLVSNQSLALSRKIGWLKGIPKGHLQIAICYKYLADYPKAIMELDKSIDAWNKYKIRNTGDSNIVKKGLVKIYMQYASIYGLQLNKTKSLYYHNFGLKLAKEINDIQLQAGILGNIAVDLTDIGDYDKALQYILESTKLFAQINDEYSTMRNYQNIGNLYGLQGQNDKALYNLNKALLLSIKNNDKRIEAAALTAMAGLKSDINKLNEKINLLKKAEVIYQNIGDTIAIVTNWCHVADAYYLLNNKDSVVSYAKKAKIIAEKNNMSYELHVANMYLAMALNLKGEYKLAEKYFKTLYSESKNIPVKRFHEKLNFFAYNFYKTVNKPKEALEHYENYILYRDSLINEESNKKQIGLELKYEYEKKAAADSVKVAEERKISQLKLKQEKTQKQYLYIGLLAITFFGIFMFNRFRVTKKQKNIIEQQKVIVEQQKALVDEKQKEIIDSIRYAKRIQDSLMPSRKYLYKKLNSNA